MASDEELIFSIEDLSDGVDAEDLHERKTSHYRESNSYGMDQSQSTTSPRITSEAVSEAEKSPDQSNSTSLAEEVKEGSRQSAALKADIEAFCADIEMLKKLRDKMLKGRSTNSKRFQKVFDEIREIRLANEREKEQVEELVAEEENKSFEIIGN